MALAAFSPRTRDFFAAFGKFEGFERAAPVPAAAGHVPCAFPGAPAGRRGTGRGAGRAHRQAKQHEKSTRSNDLVLSCTPMGMRALASLPDVPCLNIIAHRRGVVNTAPASKGICQALAALQIPLTWYNLEPPSTGARGRAREKRAGLPAHCAPRAWSRRRAAQELPARTPGCSDKKVGELAPQLCAASEGAPRLGRPKHLVLPATGWAGNGAEWGDGGAPRLRAVLYAAGMVVSKRAPGSVGAPPGRGVRARPEERAPEKLRRPRSVRRSGWTEQARRRPTDGGAPGNGAALARRARCSARSVRRRVRRRAPRQRRRASEASGSPPQR